MKKIPLTQGKFALVNDEDYERLNQYKWYAYKNGHIFYVRRNLPHVNGKQTGIHMHHEIIGYPPKGYMSDHRNGRGWDNQRHNLRFVTCRQNQQNQKNRNKSSQFPGVCWSNRDKKWVAQIKINGKGKWLGRFTSEVEAFNVYCQAVESIGEKMIGAKKRNIANGVN